MILRFLTKFGMTDGNNNILCHIERKRDISSFVMILRFLTRFGMTDGNNNILCHIERK